MVLERIAKYIAENYDKDEEDITVETTFESLRMESEDVTDMYFQMSCEFDFIPDEDFVLFAEDLNEPAYKIDRYFTQLLNIEKSLVYFTTSLKSNELVMERTLRGKKIKLYEDDEEILEDSITENKQAIEMAKIYSDILNGTMETYASIISNNLNGVMKFLTSITIVLAIPTMISSFWGMNVNVPFANAKYGFLTMLIISVVLTILVTIWLKRKDMLD